MYVCIYINTHIHTHTYLFSHYIFFFVLLIMKQKFYTLIQSYSASLSFLICLPWLYILNIIMPSVIVSSVFLSLFETCCFCVFLLFASKLIALGTSALWCSSCVSSRDNVPLTVIRSPCDLRFLLMCRNPQSQRT